MFSGLQSASETGGYGAVGIMVGRMGSNALLGRFRCGFDAVAGHRGYVPCGRGGEIVDLWSSKCPWGRGSTAEKGGGRGGIDENLVICGALQGLDQE